MKPEMDEIQQAADMIREARRVVVFTGAGISTESGISDFRSPGGLWEKYDPNEMTFDRFLASEETRQRYWEMHRSLWPTVAGAQPNAAHLGVAELDRMGKLDCVITQNIDGLHQRAGLPDEKVIEIHGTMKWVVCLECAKRYPREEVEQWLDRGVRVPRCEECGGIVKPTTISFGQAMPVRETEAAEAAAASCDLFIVIGSSLVVYPAAQMPLIAKRNGARLMIINATPTPHDSYADVVIRGKAGEVMEAIVARLR